MDKANKIIIIYFLVIILGFVLYLAFLFFTPYTYNFMIGKKAINLKVDNIVGNESDPAKESLLILEWIHQNVHYPVLEERLFPLGPTGKEFTRLTILGSYS